MASLNVSSATIATCIGCDCTDVSACIVRGTPCHWLRVDREIGKGVCSSCRHKLQEWDKAHKSPAKPARIQLSRKKGWRMPQNTVKVARPTRWGNPCRVGMYRDYTAADAVDDYRRYLQRDVSVRSFENAYGPPPPIDQIRAELRGKNLACFCPLDAPCHADVLLEIANG